MSKKDTYKEQLQQEFNNAVEGLELKATQKFYLKSRWLDQVLWMEGRASKAQGQYYKMRLTSLIGGVIIPILISLNPSDQKVAEVIRYTSIGLGAVVAISTATEQFFNYGERWRHYRRSVESLKTQGWQFFELSGPYLNYPSHEQAFHAFAGQIEEILQHDVEVYATKVTQTTTKDGSNEAAADGQTIPVNIVSTQATPVKQPISAPASAAPASEDAAAKRDAATPNEASGIDPESIAAAELPPENPVEPSMESQPFPDKPTSPVF